MFEQIRARWRPISTAIVAAMLLGTGAYAARSYLGGDCCAQGASCCKPGAACCKGGGAHASLR